MKNFLFIALLLLFALRSPATGVAVNGQPAQTNGDFTFAATNLSLASGNNNFTSIAQNKYGLAVTNTITVNLPQTVNLAFDNNGNLTNDGTRTFSYNTENQLTNVLLPGQWRSDFIYDGLGRRRIVKEYSWNGSWAETNEIHIIYDGYLPIQERNSNNAVLVTYTRGLDLSESLQGAGGIGGLLARTDANGSTFYHSDGAGNITALMDGQEDIVARYMYGPFGKIVGQWGSMAGANEMQFSSMPRESLSGLSLYPFRAYEPNFQRWLSQDPIQEWGGINLYDFGRNDPSRWIDPYGLDNTPGQGYSPEHIWDIYNPNDSIMGAMNAEADARIDSEMEQTEAEYNQTEMNLEVQLALLPTPEGDFETLANALRNINNAREAAGIAKPTLTQCKNALKQVHKLVGKLPKGKPGKFGSPQAGDSRKGYRLDPPHPSAPASSPESKPHINWWDYTDGKKGSGGRNGAVPIE